jgi:protein subunit release factor B
MLTRYAESRGFKTELLSANESETGGFKGIFAVKGDGAHSIFKYEGGTHRVQRVPRSSRRGRDPHLDRYRRCDARSGGGRRQIGERPQDRRLLVDRTGCSDVNTTDWR